HPRKVYRRAWEATNDYDDEKISLPRYFRLAITQHMAPPAITKEYVETTMDEITGGYRGPISAAKHYTDYHLPTRMLRWVLEVVSHIAVHVPMSRRAVEGPGNFLEKIEAGLASAQSADAAQSPYTAAEEARRQAPATALSMGGDK